MPFDPNSVKIAGKKSKKGLVKKEGPYVKEMMEILYEKVLGDLIVKQEKLTKPFDDSTYGKHLKLLVNENK